MKKLALLTTIVLILLLVFTACNQTQPAQEAQPAQATTESETKSEEKADAKEDTTEAKPADDQIVIGFNQGTEAMMFLRLVHENIALEAEKAGAKLLFTESNFDPEQILPNINTLLMQGADVIIDFNCNAEIGGNIVEICKEKGVPVIGVDVEYTSAAGDTSWFMGANNQRSGELIGEAFAEEVTKNRGGQLDKVVLFFNSENGEEVKKRVGGIVDGLKNKGMELTESQIEWIDMGGGGADTTEAAKTKFTDFLTANPNLKNIAAAGVNDETCQGLLSAVETSNRQADVIIGSNNCSGPYIDTVRSGIGECWIGSVAYFPEKYGEYLVPLAIALAKGENPPKKTLMEHVFVTRDMVEEYYPQ